MKTFQAERCGRRLATVEITADIWGRFLYEITMSEWIKFR